MSIVGNCRCVPHTPNTIDDVVVNGLVPLDPQLWHDGMSILLGVPLRRSPGKVVPADLDVVVGELSVLIVIHAEQFGLLVGTELETRNHVDDLGQDRRDDKRVGRGGDDECNLDVELLVVLVQETTRDEAGVDTVETNDVVGREEAVEEEADNATDVMLGEHVEGVVDAEEEFD